MPGGFTVEYPEQLFTQRTEAQIAVCRFAKINVTKMKRLPYGLCLNNLSTKSEK